MIFTKIKNILQHPEYAVILVIVVPICYVVISIISDQSTMSEKPFLESVRSYTLIGGSLVATLFASQMVWSILLDSSNIILLKRSLLSYDLLSKIVYITLPILITTISYDIILHGNFLVQDSDLLDPISKMKNHVDTAIASSTMLSFTMVIIFRTVIPEFKLNFARGCLVIASSDEITHHEKMKYVILGLDAYNNFLYKNIHLQIGNLEHVYSKIISNSMTNMDEIIMNVSKKLSNTDRLSTLRYLKDLMDDSDNKQMLIKKSLGKQIKDWMPIISVIISTSVLVGNFLLPHIKTT